MTGKFYLLSYKTEDSGTYNFLFKQKIGDEAYFLKMSLRKKLGEGPLQGSWSWEELELENFW